MKILKKLLIPFILLANTAILMPQVPAMSHGEHEMLKDPIIVYSSRKEHLIKPLFEAFSAETGIKVDFLTAKDGALIERLKLEGDKTPADILMTVDAGNLWYAESQGLLRSIDSPILASTIPSHLKDDHNRWFGLSVRARTIVYNTNQVSPSELSTYADLAQPKWKNRLCLRTAKKVYNKSLVASLIDRYGANKTTEIVRGWVSNLTTKPFAKDSHVIKAVAAGQCDIGIVNTYYYARYMIDKPNAPIKLFWANQMTSGVHVNISGAGVTKYSQNSENAQRLIEWLSLAKAQSLYAQLNNEYPANQNIQLNDIVAVWGAFKQDTMNLTRAGQLQSQAVRLMQQAGYR